MQDPIPLALSYDDVLLVPQSSQIKSRSDVDLSTQITPHVLLKLPLISSNMDTVTGVEMAIALGQFGGLGVLPRFNTPQQQAAMVRMVKEAGVICAAAIGIKAGFLERTKQLVEAGVDMIVIDVAHGHMHAVSEVARQIKDTWPDLDLVAGNVATAEATECLFAAGADCVKVGVGPGTACITRIQTGFGVPQISAVMEAASVAKKLGKTLICDGGTKNSGDIVKGLAAGSHAVMAGSLFAGLDESPGEIVTKDGKQYKKYNGSASSEEKQKQIGKLGQEHVNKTYLEHVEGVSAYVPYKGSLEIVVHSLLSGIRSGFSYAGAANLKQLHQKARFIRISPLGVRESNHHDLILAETDQQPS